MLLNKRTAKGCHNQHLRVLAEVHTSVVLTQSRIYLITLHMFAHCIPFGISLTFDPDEDYTGRISPGRHNASLHNKGI